jgi:VIT1/CCC1 family predicted Fe2+/Mn2+ transporter
MFKIQFSGAFGAICCFPFNYFFFISMGLTGISLFILGAIKNIILARSWWRGGFYVLFTGGIATGCAFVVGWLLELLLKV